MKKLRYLSVLVFAMILMVVKVNTTQAETLVPSLVKAPAATCTWNGTVGNWNDSTKWSCAAVPGAADTAVVSSGTITLTAGVALGTLTFSGGTIQGSSNMTVTNMTWTGGTWKDAGTTTVNSTLDMSNSSDALDARTLINAGSAVLGGSSVYLILYNGAQFTNQAGASLNFSHTSTGQITYSTGGGSFNNSGSITKTFASSGFTYIYAGFHNSGSVTVTNGIFQMSPAASVTNSSTGTLTASSASATFQFSSGTLNMDGSIKGLGTANFSGGTVNVNGSITGLSTVNFSGATVNFNVGSTYAVSSTSVTGGNVNFSSASAVNFGNVVASSGTLQIGDATLSGNLTRNGGTFTASTGKLTFNGGKTQSLSLNVATTFNDLSVDPGTTLVETAAANNATVAGVLSNQGIIRKTETLSAAGLYTFGLTGAVISVQVPGSLSTTTVDWVGQPHPSATPNIAADHYWTITPSGSGYTASLTLPHTLPLPVGANACHFNSGTQLWECAASAFTASTVSLNGITALAGDWAIGEIYHSYLPNVIH